MSKKRFEFSKLIIITVGIITIAVTIFTLYMVWETKDMTALAYLIPAIFAETASATGFYYWKSKAENQLKLSRIIKKEELNDAISEVNNITNNSEYM